ncbi:uncharacterized protein [Cicer arietinum]|uniref:uncharacterized protein isoform X5 n=1 Tax=Cicer arietinum TaxID=3827 RepID=UPI003CC51CEB
MVYSTCSMNPIENEAVVAEWLHNLQTENGILANGRMTLKEVLIQQGKIIPCAHCRMGTIGKLLHQKQHGNANVNVKKKDLAPVENARVQ